jgi:hypothetical protein
MIAKIVNDGGCKQSDIVVIPAPPGYFAIEGYWSDDEYSFSRSAIVAWRIDQSDPDWVTTEAVRLAPTLEHMATQLPDGSVEGLNGGIWPTLYYWEAAMKQVPRRSRHD